MPSLPEVLDMYRSWKPKPLSEQTTSLEFACTVSGPASESAIRQSWGDRPLPQEALTLWRECGGARLFEDVKYGQWGLVLFSPAESLANTQEQLAARPDEYIDGDVVIGRFLGDLEVVVVSPTDSGMRRVLVALDMDPRRDWWPAARTIEDFLLGFLDSYGEKFWEKKA